MADFFIGESLVGEGNEVAHIDLVIGSKSGPAGAAFCNALTNNKDGFTTLLAVVAPNLAAKPDTILFNKVTIKGAKQAVQMFGPAQAAVARAVVDSVESGVIPRDKADDYVVMVGVFIHWDASRRQEDLRLQLPGDERVDSARAGAEAVGQRRDLRLEDGEASLQSQVTQTASRQARGIPSLSKAAIYIRRSSPLCTRVDVGSGSSRTASQLQPDPDDRVCHYSIQCGFWCMSSSAGADSPGETSRRRWPVRVRRCWPRWSRISRQLTAIRSSPPWILASRCRRRPASMCVTMTSTRGPRLNALISSVDAVWLIAPETDRCLERLTARAERKGTVILGSGSDAIRRASDKAALPRLLARHGVPHPETRVIDPSRDELEGSGEDRGARSRVSARRQTRARGRLRGRVPCP